MANATEFTWNCFLCVVFNLFMIVQLVEMTMHYVMLLKGGGIKEDKGMLFFNYT